jgi:hypothetical protein
LPAAAVLVLALACGTCGCESSNAESQAFFRGLHSETRPHPARDRANAPTGLSAKAAGRNRIELVWKDDFRNERGYIIERSDGREFAEIARVDADTCSFSDTRLSPSTTYTYRVRAYNSLGTSDCSNTCSITTTPLSGPIIIDHTCIDLESIPVYWIKAARNVLHIAYGHTSHGSQIITGMTGLVSFKGSLYAFQSGSRDGDALDLRDQPFSGAADLGNPDRTAWARATRSYLERNPEVNVVVWSWCGQADTTRENIDLYLSLMERLKEDYPSVAFVYMTGHLNGTGLRGNLHQRNDQIRDFCTSKGKILYDFEDIESHDPDGTYFGNNFPTDGCDYDSDMNGSRDANWALQWQNSHIEGQDWYHCESAHSKPLNANMKAHAAWWLWARLAGWDGT